MKKVKTAHIIDVIQDDIERGVSRSCARCPLARAISRAIGMQCDVSLDVVISFCFGKPHKRGFLSEQAENFVYRFDYGMPVEPFTFTLVLEGYEE